MRKYWWIPAALLLVITVATTMVAVIISVIGWYWGIIFAALLVIAVSATAFVRVSTINYGVVLLFGKRTGRVLDEGLHLILPLGIETVELVSNELRTSELEVATFSEDNMEIIIKGSTQWRPVSPIYTYKTVENKWGGRTIERSLTLRFLEMSDETIVRGINDAVKDELGVIAGRHSGTSFIKARETIGDIIHCVLRLKTMPHRDPHTGTETERKRSRLKFYKKHADAIREKLDSENTRGSNSDIELRYGIDIAKFAISTVTFSGKTKESLEKKRQAELEKAGATVRVSQKVEAVNTLMEKGGLTRDQAHDTSDAILGTATPRQIVELRGARGSLPVINVNKGG